MSDRDDPFGLGDDAGRTRIRPRRQDRSGATFSAGTARDGPSPGEPAPRIRQLRASDNPLVNAFAALAGIFVPDVLDDLKFGRDVIELL